MFSAETIKTTLLQKRIKHVSGCIGVAFKKLTMDIQKKTHYFQNKLIYTTPLLVNQEWEKNKRILTRGYDHLQATCCTTQCTQLLQTTKFHHLHLHQKAKYQIMYLMHFIMLSVEEHTPCKSKNWTRTSQLVISDPVGFLKDASTVFLWPALP